MDSVRCGKCGYVYWTSSFENWGTCTKCGTNNDYANSNEKPILVNSKFIFKTVTIEEIETDKKLNQEKRNEYYSKNLVKIIDGAVV